MNKHKPSDEMLKELDALLSKINAMEIVASERAQKDTVQVLRALVRGQMHSVTEFEHLKKAIDLLTQQVFEIRDQIRN